MRTDNNDDMVWDINIHLERQKDPENWAFRNLIASIGLRLIIEGPTHVRGETLDIVLERDPESIQHTYVLNFDARLSDHLFSGQLYFRPSDPPLRSISCDVGVDLMFTVSQSSSRTLFCAVGSYGLRLVLMIWQHCTWLYKHLVMLTDLLDKQLLAKIVWSHGHRGLGLMPSV